MRYGSNPMTNHTPIRMVAMASSISIVVVLLALVVRLLFVPQFQLVRTALR
jgi:hypothetical protein